MPTRADVRPTRRAFLFSYLGSLLPRRSANARLALPRLSIADGLGWLICWRGNPGLLAGAS